MTPSAEQLATQCVQCGYSLKGLPDDSVCPECGLPYCRAARVFGGQGHAPKWLGYVVMGMLLLFCLTVMPSLKRELTILILPALPLTGIVWIRLRSRQDTFCIVVHPGGLKIGATPANWSFIPWSEISSARASWIFGNVKIRNRKGKTAARWRIVGGGAWREAVELQRLIQSHISSHRTPRDPTR
jgi:hypothetical protein